MESEKKVNHPHMLTFIKILETPMWTSFRNIIFFFYCYDHATIQISRHLYNIRNCIFALERLKDKTFTMEEICHRCGRQ